MARFPPGRLIREQRQKLRMTQASLAAAVGISAPYLNLIEHDKRPIGGTLLNRIAAVLEVEPGRFAGGEDVRLAQDLLELGRTLSGVVADEAQALQLAAVFPDWARAIVQLHRSYRDTAEIALALSDRLSQDSTLIELSHALLSRVAAIRSFAEILHQHPDLERSQRERFSGIVASEADRLGVGVRAMVELLGAPPGSSFEIAPNDEVDEYINYHNNYFPELEDAAEHLRHQLGGGDHPPTQAILARLATHGLTVVEDYDGAAGPDTATQIHIDARRSEASRRFILARQLVGVEFADLLAQLADDPRLVTSDAARALCRRALANYLAGALLLPYDKFLGAAEAWRYDIDRLAHHFSSSFEQAAHRLVTLRRPGAEGIPFAFLRSDPAGNLSKRFSTVGLRMPRFSGACPLWPLYTAFRSPERVVAQLAVMPEGEHYLLAARCISKRAAGFGQTETVYSIMIGCDASHRDRIVYGDGFTGSHGASVTEAGFSCRSCSRSACPQRAHPLILASGAQNETPTSGGP